MSQSNELDRFLALSNALTGEEELDEGLAGQYLQRLNEQYQTPMQRLLDAFGEIAGGKDLAAKVRQRIIENNELSPLAQQVINIWYTSEFIGADNKTTFTGKQNQYNSGLLWKAIKAHPPAHSTEEYGYWTTEPE